MILNIEENRVDLKEKSRLWWQEMCYLYISRFRKRDEKYWRTDKSFFIYFTENVHLHINVLNIYIYLATFLFKKIMQQFQENNLQCLTAHLKKKISHL